MRRLVAALMVLSATALSVQACDSATAHKPTAPSGNQLIVDGWQDAMTAFFTAAEQPGGPDPNYPGLTQNLVPPLLTRLRSLLANEARRGWLVQGPWSLGDPQVTSLQATSATVISCVAGGDVVVDPHTHHPLPGQLGEPNMVGTSSTMREIGGRWLESAAQTQSFPYQGGRGSCGTGY